MALQNKDIVTRLNTLQVEQLADALGIEPDTIEKFSLLPIEPIDEKRLRAILVIELKDSEASA
jgi:hypothetical protein